MLVLEYGGTDTGPLIQMPAAFSIPMNLRAYDWGYRTEPEPQSRRTAPRHAARQGDRRLLLHQRHGLRARPCGRISTAGRRPAPRAGASSDVLPYFKRMETAHLNGSGDDARRAGAAHDGPLHVTRGAMTNPLYQRLHRGRASRPATASRRTITARAQEGFGPMEMTVWQGRRWSAANAYLRPALKRPNVALRTGLLRREHSSSRDAAPSASWRAAGAAWRRCPRQKEVIVAASAINSPKLLMLSGIGPAEHLRRQRHRRRRAPARRRRQSAGPPRGLCAAGLPEADHAERASRPLWRAPGSACNGSSSATASAPPTTSRPAPSSAPPPASPIPTCSFISCRPRCAMTAAPPPPRTASRCISGRCARLRAGSVRLVIARSATAPSIRFNYMSAEEDWRDFRAAIRLTREIFAQAALAAFRGEEIAPGQGRAIRRGARRIRARARGERLPSLRHLPHGRGRRRRTPSSTPTAA